MTETKGGKGLHGPDKRQDALRDEGSGASGKGDPGKAGPLNEARHQQGQRSADMRQDVPDETLRRGDSDLPEGLSRKRMGPLDKDTGRGRR
jgi:hypothetical protein